MFTYNDGKSNFLEVEGEDCDGEFTVRSGVHSGEYGVSFIPFDKMRGLHQWLGEALGDKKVTDKVGSEPVTTEKFNEWYQGTVSPELSENSFVITDWQQGKDIVQRKARLDDGLTEVGTLTVYLALDNGVIDASTEPPGKGEVGTIEVPLYAKLPR